MNLIIISNEFEDRDMEAASQRHPVFFNPNGVVLDVLAAGTQESLCVGPQETAASRFGVSKRQGGKGNRRMVGLTLLQ